MLFRFYLWPYSFDPSVRSNQKGDAVGALIFAAHETLLAPDTIRLHDCLLLIRQKREGKFEFLRELLVGLNGIYAHAKHHCASSFVLRKIIAKSASFFGAP